MSAVVHRRMLVQSAQALAKTNAPTPAHYEAVLEAIAQVFADDTGWHCDCRMIKKDGATPTAPANAAPTDDESGGRK